MAYYCPKCRNSDSIKVYINTLSILSGTCKMIGAGLAALSTPIGKSYSLREAERLRRDAESDFSDKRCYCERCRYSF